LCFFAQKTTAKTLNFREKLLQNPKKTVNTQKSSVPIFKKGVHFLGTFFVSKEITLYSKND
jgi:molybdopterin synthase catalytic subunit